MSLSREVLTPLLRFCEETDTPISLGVHLRIKYECWDELALMEVRPEWYAAPYPYFLDRQAACWLSKFEDLPTSFNRRESAYTANMLSEQQCCLTNERLTPYLLNGPYEAPGDLRIADQIDQIRKRVKRILGACPVEPEFRFGPGATLSDGGSTCTIATKCQSTPTMTMSAAWLLPFWARTAWGRNPACKDIELVDAARWTTVPKNAKTDRGIEIQPSINVAAQLGYGSAIRNRLKRANIDLDTAQELHRELARRASVDDSLATLDLKSASDTIAWKLVKLLLPPDWFWVLDSLRCDKIAVGEKIFNIQRFSSMGNGFTFELETLLFYAISRQFSTTCHVFGDDIIVSSSDAYTVQSALKFFGFTTNLSKSFFSGCFRESCGGDFFLGRSVRPFYLKKEPDEPQKVISYCNGIRRAANQFSDSTHLTPFHRGWLFLTEQLPTTVRACRGPNDLGDLCLHDDRDFWSTRMRHGVLHVKCYVPFLVDGLPWSRFDGCTQLAAALYGVRLALVGPTKNRVRGLPLRGSVFGYRIKWVTSLG